MRLAEFDYELPPGRIAQEPVSPRDSARLLVHDLPGGATLDRRVRDLPDLLAAGDLLVVNDTRVEPWGLLGARASGGAVEVLLVEREAPGTWRALVRPAARLRPGELVLLEGGALAARMIERCRGERGGRDPHWRIALAAPDGGDVEGALARVGRAPLPPYVERDPRDARRRERDRLDYQTVYARAPGAIAAPTAGLHLTEDLLARLLARGVGIARVTLHVGEGTFLPVEAEEIEDHQMHAESFELPAGTAEEIGRCRRGGGRVVAVGTTSARVLETCAREDGTVEARAGLTELFLRPGSRLRVVDALLTNFHLPRSTLLMLVAACAGLERTRALYRHALEAGYRFYSFGDAMLLIGMRHRDSSGAVGPCS